jgi:hypothetical protein
MSDCQLEESTQLDEQLRSFWELESLGICNEEKTLYDEFTDNITFQDGRYEVTLPWKEFHQPLADNLALCMRRLNGLLTRLRHDPGLLKQYNSTIQEQLQKGNIEPVCPGTTIPDRVHYLPHHGVVRADKTTTKLRVVYDASARTHGPSLNECLYKGPKLNQLILDLVIRFRSYKVAVTADVEKAFLMIAVYHKNCDVLRLLWLDDKTKEKPEIRIYRFTRVVFGVSSSPFLLNATVKYHLERFIHSHEDVVKRLLQSTYVDDIITGADSDDEAFELYKQAKDIFQQGSFNLRKFLSSSRSLQRRIDVAEGLSDPSEVEEAKVLGVNWNPGSDSLTFDLSIFSRTVNEMRPTKRNVVSLIGRFFDPLGFLTPATVVFKILFQGLCQTKISWDDDLTGELLREWKLLCNRLGEAVPISIPRGYMHRVTEEPHSYTLCGICDASTVAYAAVIYLVIKTQCNTYVKFVVAKTRVAPIQPQTIPRLELMSALLLCRLITSASRSLTPVLPSLFRICYTDSQVTLFWIRGITKEWKPFVNHRVKQIREKVPPEFWRHCPGISNPADLPSRGMTPLELSVNQLWRRGPDCLQVGLTPTPQCELIDMPEPCAMEMKLASRSTVSVDSGATIE